MDETSRAILKVAKKFLKHCSECRDCNMLMTSCLSSIISHEMLTEMKKANLMNDIS